MTALPKHLIALFAALLFTAAAPLHAYDPAAGDFTKRQPDAIRILTWNVHNNFIYTVDDDGRYQRVTKAVNPDIICFQEMDHSLTAADIRTRLQSYFPGSTWYIHRGKADGSNTGVSNRNVIASRYPLSMTRQDTLPTSDIRGVAIALVDLPDATYDKDLYLMNIHFKAGNTETDHQKRQKHADAIINWMRDARTPGGNVDLPAGTPMIVTGDFNFSNARDMAPYHASHTMLKGNIFNTGTFGPSSPPDWDGTTSADASPYDYNTGEVFTHSSSDPKGRIDRFYYTDSVLHTVGGFVFNSRTMTAAARTAAGGILVNDTSGASDHLPIVCDFALGPDPAPPAQLIFNEFNANDIGANDKTFLEIKNVGGREINLDGPVDYFLKESHPLTTSAPAGHNEQYAFNLRGVVPPDGLFVIYDSAGQGNGVAAAITSRLPALQRQDQPGFVLDNDNNTAIVLVERTWTHSNLSFETPIEALGWASTNPTQTSYFRLNSGNNRLVAINPAQWTTFYVNGTASDNSVSRNPGDKTLNSLVNWTTNTPITPGQENPPPATIADWTIY